jgi:hypothetical protein
MAHSQTNECHPAAALPNHRVACASEVLRVHQHHVKNLMVYKNKFKFKKKKNTKKNKFKIKKTKTKQNKTKKTERQRRVGGT